MIPAIAAIATTKAIEFFVSGFALGLTLINSNKK